MSKVAELEVKAGSVQHANDYAKALEYFKLKDFPHALDLWRKGALLSHPPSMCDYGWMLSKGIECAQDELMAFTFMKRAAESGYPRAQNNVGLYYLKGLGHPPSLPHAVFWLQTAKKQNYSKLAAESLIAAEQSLDNDGWDTLRQINASYANNSGSKSLKEPSSSSSSSSSSTAVVAAVPAAVVVMGSPKRLYPVPQRNSSRSSPSNTSPKQKEQHTKQQRDRKSGVDVENERKESIHDSLSVSLTQPSSLVTPVPSPIPTAHLLTIPPNIPPLPFYQLLKQPVLENMSLTRVNSHNNNSNIPSSSSANRAHSPIKSMSIQSSSLSHTNIVAMLRAGQVTEAHDAFLALAKTGDAQSMCEAGLMYILKGNSQKRSKSSQSSSDKRDYAIEGLAWLISSAMHECEKAIINLCTFATTGHVLWAPNMEVVKHYLTLVANKQQHSNIQFMLNNLVINNIGASKHSKTDIFPECEYRAGLYLHEMGKSELSFRCWYRSANAGDTSAMCDLGWAYGEGKGCIQNERLALYYVHKAAAGGLPRAMNNVGLYFSKGTGTSVDKHRALYWLRKAKQEGFGQVAMRTLEKLESELGSPPLSDAMGEMTLTRAQMDGILSQDRSLQKLNKPTHSQSQSSSSVSAADVNGGGKSGNSVHSSPNSTVSTNLSLPSMSPVLVPSISLSTSPSTSPVELQGQGQLPEFDPLQMQTNILQYHSHVELLYSDNNAPTDIQVEKLHNLRRRLGIDLSMHQRMVSEIINETVRREDADVQLHTHSYTVTRTHSIPQQQQQLQQAQQGGSVQPIRVVSALSVASSDTRQQQQQQQASVTSPTLSSTSSSSQPVNDQSLCAICCTEVADYVVIPCMHMCLCEGCSEIEQVKRGTCPMCRTDISDIKRIYK